MEIIEKSEGGIKINNRTSFLKWKYVWAKNNFLIKSRKLICRLMTAINEQMEDFKASWRIVTIIIITTIHTNAYFSFYCKFYSLRSSAKLCRLQKQKNKSTLCFYFVLMLLLILVGSE